MKTMWHISRWGDLSPVEVVRETEKTVWTVNGRRQAKKADYNTMIFDKKSEAIEYYLDRIDRKAKQLREDLSNCVDEMEKYKRMLYLVMGEENAEGLDKPEEEGGIT